MAEQKSRLVIEISTENAKRNAELLNQEIQKLTEKGDRASASSSALGKELKTTGESAKTLGDSTSKATKELAQQESQLNKNGTAVVQLAKYVAGYLTISKAISMADGYTQMAARIKNATANAQEYALVQERLYQTANTTYRSLAEAQEVYLSMSGGMKSLGYNTAQTLDMTDSLSFAFTANATRADQAQSAMDALSKSMAKGKVDADAWISIVTGADNVIADMAKTTGKSEAAIRQLGAEGKISLSDLIKTLIQTKDANEALANNMENSFADGMQKLSNAVTVYLGKANESTSATGMMASALGELADNLDAVADVAILGGVAYLTQAIASQTVAIKASVTSSFAKRAALTAELQSQATLAAVEVQRTRQVVALAATEVNLARAEYNSATSRTARAAATMRLTQAEVAYGLASKQSTMATVAQTTAQNALNASQAIGTRMLALVGGPIGALTLGVTALAAGYMYMQSRAEEANKKLQDQASVAKKAKEELLALQGLEKDDAIKKMTTAFQLQNEALTESSSKVNMQLNAIEQLYKGNKDVVKVVQDARNGTISMTDAVAKFNELRISKDIYNSFKANSTEFVKNATEAKNTKEKLNLLGFEFELSGRKAQISAVGVDANTKSLNANETAASKAAKAQTDYFDSLKRDVLSANERLAYMNMGYSKEVIDEIGKLQEAKEKALGGGATAIITNDEITRIVNARNVLDAVGDRESAIAKAKQDQTKEAEKHLKLSEKQAALLAGNDEKVRNMLRVYQAFRSAGLGDKQARVMTAQVGRENDYRTNAMFGSHKDNNNGYTNTGFISWQKGRSTQLMQFLQGQGLLDNKGKIQQTQDSLDAMAKFFVQEVMTEKSYASSRKALTNDNLDYRTIEKIVGKNAIGWDYNGKGKIGKAKAADHLSKQDSYYSKISEILGKDPENVMSAIKDLSKFQDEAYKARAKTEEEIKQLQIQYDTDAIKRSKLRDEESNRATILGQTQLLPKIKERYDAQDKLATLQFDSELNAYKWTEEQKIEYAYQTNLLRLDAEGQYNDEVKAKAKASYKELHDYELSAYKRLQQDKLNEFKWGLEQQTGELQRALIEAQAQLYLTPSQTAKWQLQNEYSSSVGGAWDGYQNSIKDVNKKDDKDQYINDAQTRHQMLLAAEQQYQDQLKLIKEKSVADDLLLLQQQRASTLAGYSNMFGSITTMMQGFGDSSSTTYKTMFALQKAFSLSSAIMSGYTAISAAWASAPFPYNLPAVATATMETGVLQAALQTITPQGFSEGGYTGSGGKYEPAGVVHKGEVVFSQADIARLGGVGVVEALRKGQRGYSDGGVVGSPKMVDFKVGEVKQQAPQITINNNTDSRVNARQNSNGGYDIDIDFIETQLAGRMGNANSKISKSLKQHTTASRRR